MWNKFFRKQKYILLAFFVPFLVMGSSFVLHKFFPFGDNQILLVDLWHQYFPFLSELQEKLQNGESLLYSWNIGMGTNFLGLISYYASSPLNLLTVFVPDRFLVVALAVLVLMKMGFAGMFSAIFLRKVFRRNDISIVIFSLFYGLSGFMFGYYWDVMWLDTVALLPLIALGIHKVVQEKKCGLYTIALALSLISNYYIGFFTCIFSGLYFFGVCVFYKTNRKEFFGGLGRMAFYSVLGIGMSAILLLPAYKCLQYTYYADSAFPTDPTFYYKFEELMKNMFAFQQPSYIEGAPNIYSGILPILFGAVFFSARRIKLREKLYFGFFLIFLLLSCNLNILDYIWHAFHFTNMVPHRFIFIFTFIVMVIGYRGFLAWRKSDFFDTLAMAFVTVLFLVLGYLQLEWKLFLANTILIVLLLVLCVLVKKRLLRPKFFYAALCVVLLVEYVPAAYISVETAGSSQYSTYPGDNDAVLTLVDEMEFIENGSDDFYRIEFESPYSLNDSALFHTHGITCFSSMCNSKLSYALEELGLAADDGSNRYAYELTSPMMTSFLNVKYLITRQGRFTADNWTDMSSATHLVSYRNDYYLPLGFMTEEGILDLDFDDVNPFDTQNKMFQLATGVKENIFEDVPLKETKASGCAITVYDDESYFIESDNQGKSGDATLSFEMKEGQDLYVYATSSMEKTIPVSAPGYNETINMEYPFIIFLLEPTMDDVINFNYFMENEEYGDTAVYLRSFNEEVFSRGYETLADELFEVKGYTDTSVSGQITAKEDGYFYTSIPYEKGWKLYVDGKETEIEAFQDAFIGTKLEKGTHEIELKYVPEGFVAGTAATGICVVIFTGLMILQKKRKG